MADETRLTTVETVHEEGSWLFTASDEFGMSEEYLLVPCEDGVEGWVNRCTHEAQRLDRGSGAAMRNGEIICPKHGSMFGACSGECGNGKAAGTTLPGVEVTVRDGEIFLADEGVTFEHAGGVDDGDTGSSSHLSF